MVQDVFDHTKMDQWAKFYIEAVKIEIICVTYGTKKIPTDMEYL